MQAIDLIVPDVPNAVAFFRDVVGLEVRQSFESFAELGSGSVSLMLSPDALVPLEGTRGVILHFIVDDVEAAAERASKFGASVLFGPGETPFGTESLMVQGPEGIVVDLFREMPSPPS